jgi:hypothetical protein
MPTREEVAKQPLEQRLGRMSRAADRANATPAAIAASASSGTPFVGVKRGPRSERKGVREVWAVAGLT